MSFEFNQPYLEVDPQAIKSDAIDYGDFDYEEAYNALVRYVSSDVIRDFIDDRMMGRV
jgi:hypothetical protein